MKELCVAVSSVIWKHPDHQNWIAQEWKHKATTPWNFHNSSSSAVLQKTWSTLSDGKHLWLAPNLGKYKP